MAHFMSAQEVLDKGIITDVSVCNYLKEDLSRIEDDIVKEHVTQHAWYAKLYNADPNLVPEDKEESLGEMVEKAKVITISYSAAGFPDGMDLSKKLPASKSVELGEVTTYAFTEDDLKEVSLSKAQKTALEGYTFAYTLSGNEVHVGDTISDNATLVYTATAPVEEPETPVEEPETPVDETETLVEEPEAPAGEQPEA